MLAGESTDSPVEQGMPHVTPWPDGRKSWMLRGRVPMGPVLRKAVNKVRQEQNALRGAQRPAKGD